MDTREPDSDKTDSSAERRKNFGRRNRAYITAFLLACGACCLCAAALLAYRYFQRPGGVNVPEETAVSNGVISSEPPPERTPDAETGVTRNEDADSTVLKVEISAPASDDVGFHGGIAETGGENVPAAAPRAELKSLSEEEDRRARQLLDAAREKQEAEIAKRRLEIIKSEEEERARRKKNELERDAELERRRAEREAAIENQRRERENARRKQDISVSREPIILPDTNPDKEKTEISEREKAEKTRQRELEAMRAERDAAIERQRRERENARRVWRESRGPIEPSEKKPEITFHITASADNLPIPAPSPKKNDAPPNIETPAVLSPDNAVKSDDFTDATNQPAPQKEEPAKPRPPDADARQKTENANREETEAYRQTEIERKRAEREAAIEKQRQERENARRARQKPDDSDEYE